MNHKKHVALVYDHGLFVDIAETLAKSFGKVYLYVPWEGNPSSNQLLIGRGLKGVTKIDSFWNVLEEVDLFVFPDTNEGELQVYLRSIGKRVWGSAMGEELELARVEAKKHFAKLDLNIGPYEVVVGIDALRKYLKTHDNVFVKVSRSRADFETFKSETYELIDPFLDDLEHRLGAKKSIIEFIVEDSIDDAIEIGFDGFCIDGHYPPSVMAGIEIKDAGYIGEFKRYSDLPSQLTDVNAKLADTMKKYQYRNFWAVELRVTKDGKPWVIDPCARAGSPPSELVQLMYTNLDDIMWFGAEGKVVEPIPAGKWGVEVMIISAWAEHHWQTIQFPAELRDNVRLHFTVVIDDQYWVTPQKSGVIGAVVAVGDTMEAAIENVEAIIKQVKGIFLEMNVHSLDKAQDAFDSLKEYQVNW